MKNLEYILHTESQKVSMRDHEKTAIRARLLSLKQKQIYPKSDASPFLNLYSFAWKHGASLAFVAVFFFSGGLSVVADKSLPGSFLYPLKTDINEQVLGWFAVTPQSKEELSIKLAERRLEEAELIANEPSVSDQVKEEHLKTTFDQVMVATAGDSEEIAKIEAKADVDAEAKTETETETESIPADSQIAPTAMSVSAVDAEPLEVASFSLQSASTTGTSAKQTTPTEEIAALRSTIKTLRTNLVKLEGEGSRKEETIKMQAKLLVAQKKLLIASDTKTSEEKREESLLQVNALIKSTEVFLNAKSETSLTADEVASSSPAQLSVPTQKETEPTRTPSISPL
jgi:hypothetical protein